VTDDARKRRFDAAFPWWADGKSRLGWRLEVEIKPGVEEVRRGGILLALQHTPEKDRGSIRLDMPGATVEQYDAVVAWVIAEYGQMLPSAETPNTSETRNA
jgi:hypothetical protein